MEIKNALVQTRFNRTDRMNTRHEADVRLPQGNYRLLLWMARIKRKVILARGKIQGIPYLFIFLKIFDSQ